MTGNITSGIRQSSAFFSGAISFNALLRVAYEGNLQQRLDCACDLFLLLHPILEKNTAFMSRLDELRRSADEVNRQMARMEFSRLCPQCAADPSRGGCCSFYMAGETDAFQLLLNMLVGVRVTRVREDGRECCYLGDEGCILLFKPMFCLNYLCEGIKKGCVPADLAELEKRTGRLLQLQYKMEQELLHILRQTIGV